MVNSINRANLGRQHVIKLLLILLFAVLLSSCARVRPDGPPNFYVDETKIPNAKPKPEPKAKYGNMTSYTISGKRYYTLPTSKNYSEEGIASWYGTKFHARRTSSGERYNLLAMTAAHKTLPLPTYVEVTNLKNQRKIIVKVNDRGPFKSNRIIDLSYVAAKKLGMLGRGTTHVRVTAIDPEVGAPKRNTPSWLPSFNSTLATTREAVTAKATAKKPFIFTENRRVTPFQPKSYYLQVGKFSTKVHATRAQKKLIAKLAAPIAVSKSTKLNTYHLKIGPLKDVATINKLTQQLKRMGIKANKTVGA